MSLYYRTATIEAVKAAVLDVAGPGSIRTPTEYFRRTNNRLANLRAATIGGEQAKRFLIRKIGETSSQWHNRLAHFQNVPFVSLIAGQRADMVYGTGPERSLFYVNADRSTPDRKVVSDVADGLLDAPFSRVYECSNAAHMFNSRVAQAAIRDVWCGVKVRYEEEAAELRLSYLPRQSVWFVQDPDAEDVCLGVVEVRERAGKIESVLYTRDAYGPIDDGFAWIGEPSGYDGGCIPIVRFGASEDPDFGHALDDALLDQVALINDTSQMQAGKRAQSFSQFYTTGTIKGETVKGDDGIDRIIMGPESHIQLEEGGTAGYLNPNYPLQAVSAHYKDALGTGLSRYAVSAYAADPTGAPDQPMALLIKMYPSLRQRDRDIAIFVANERQLAETVLCWGAAYGLMPEEVNDRDKVGIKIEFPETVLPMDKQTERLADQGDVDRGAMTREHYVRKHMLPDDASDVDVQAYLAKLDAEAAAKSARTAATFGSFMAPRSGGEPSRAANLFDRLSNRNAPTQEPEPEDDEVPA